MTLNYLFCVAKRSKKVRMVKDLANREVKVSRIGDSIEVKVGKVRNNRWSVA